MRLVVATLSERKTDSPSHQSMVLALLASVIAGSLVVSVRARR